MPGPEAGSPAPTPETPKSTTEVLAGVRLAVNQFEKVNKLPPEQRDQARFALADIAIGGIAELHTRGVIAGNEQIRKALQDEIFNQSDLGYKVFAERLVVKIEDMVSGNLQDPRVCQGISSLLKLSFLVGINQDKYPDLTSRLKDVSDKINQSGQSQSANQGTKFPAELNPSIAGGGNEGGGRDDEERPSGLESNRSPEWETSPEKGRWLCDEIIRLRTQFSYKERYQILDSKGRPYLKRLYKELKEYVQKICVERHEKDPWDPKKAYKDIQEAQKKNPEIKEPKPGEEVSSKAQNEQSASQEQTSQSLDIKIYESEVQRTKDEAYLESLTVEKHQENIKKLTDEYENDNTSVPDLIKIREQLAVYFREAKRKGLLQGAENLLNIIYRKHIQTGDLEIDQVTELVKQTVTQAEEDIRVLWRGGRSDDPEIDRLKGIWKPYIKWAREVFQCATTDQEPYDSLKEKGAFAFVQHELEEGRETYWKPGSWTGYYIVTAKTPEQFRIAASTFLQMIRRGSIGKSPEELYKHLQNFKEQFGTQGEIEVNSQEGKEGEKLTSEFMKQLRHEFEALSYIFGANYSNESYNPKSYNQFMMAMALHEGPERWVALYRSGEGMVSAFTDMFDHRDFMEIYNNPVGDQGELDVIAQHFMRDQIKQIAIEKGIGIQLKDYDPEDKNPYPLVEPKERKKAEQARREYLQDNLKRLGIHMTSEEFKGLYEGFDNGDAHKNNYQEYVKKKNLTSEQLQQLPYRLQKSIELGEVQVELDNIRKEMKEGIGSHTLKTRKTAVEVLEKRNPKAYKIYKAAYEKAEANFGVAFQMQGATGEKVRKGKGFFYIDRNIHVQAYRGLGSETELEQAVKLEKICAEIKRGNQLSADDTKTYNTALVAFRTNLERIKGERLDEKSAKVLEDVLKSPEEVFRNLYEGVSGDAHKKNYEKFKELDKNLVQAYRGLVDDRSKRIGRILTEIKKGRKLDIFTWEVKSETELEQAVKLEKICAEIKRGNQLSADDTKTYNTALVAFRTNLERIKGERLDEKSAKVLEDVLKSPEEVFRNLYEGVSGDAHKKNYEKFKELDKNLYSRFPRRLKMSLTYGGTQGKKTDALNKQELLIRNAVQDMIFYQGLSEEDKVNIVDHMPVYLAESAVQYVVNQIKIQHANDPVAVRRQAVDAARYDAVNQVQLNGWEAKFKLKEIIFDVEGNVEGVGRDKEVDLKTAAESVLSRYTTHTYWAYQPENRHMLLTDQVFKAAKLIRAGSRPGDKDILATQLLLVDPTLNRVAKLDGDLMEKEITILNAAVEESYQDRQQIVRDLYSAFLPKTGNRDELRVGYNFEDWGGSIRLAMGAREMAASQPTRFARRLGAGIAFIPMEIDSMPAIWGAQGVSGVIEMFADQIHEISDQRIVGQFGIAKFIDQMKYGESLRIALFGGINPETGKEQEGLFKKPTNNSEELNDLCKQMTEIKEGRSLDTEVRLLHAMLKSFGRLDEVIKQLGAEASLVRNAQGALWLRDKEIFLQDGRYNSEEINKDTDTGTGRHSEELFFNSYMKWLLSKDEGGGAKSYAQEQWWYELLEKPCLLNTTITRKAWIFNKIFSG